MDSVLDIKFKRLINKYYQREDYKLNQIFLHKKVSKPYTVIQRKNKNSQLTLSTKNDRNHSQQTNSKMIKPRKMNNNNKNKFILKRFKSLSINNVSKETIETKSDNEKSNLVSSDILKEKSILLSLRKQFSINSLINNKLRNQENKIEFFKKNISESNLKINQDKIHKIEEKKGNKRLSKFAMRNNLYFKYSSILSGAKKNIKNNDNDNDYYYRVKKIKENNKEHLTHSEPNNAFNFNNIYKRNLNLPNLKINKQIINNDEKIYINCLFSKINAKLNAKKIFKNYKVKTIYNIQEEDSYKRIHSLDMIFSKLMKQK